MDEECIECGHRFDFHHLKNGVCSVCNDEIGFIESCSNCDGKEENCTCGFYEFEFIENLI